MTGLALLSAFFLAGTVTTSPTPNDFCGAPRDGVVDFSGDTVVFAFRDCGHPMTREQLVDSMACEDARAALTKQRRRLQSRLRADNLNVVACPAGFRFRVDNAASDAPLGSHIKHVGVVLLAPSRVPSERSAIEEDESLLKRISGYFLERTPHNKQMQRPAQAMEPRQ